MYLFHLLVVIGKRPHKLEYIYLYFVVLGSMVVKKITLVLRLYSSSVSGVLFLVHYSPCCLMCRCPVVVFIDFSRWSFINPYMRPGHFLRKPILIALRRLFVIRIKSAALKYCANSCLVVWARILFTTIFIVVFPSKLSTLLFVCSWYLSIIFVNCFGL